jgi:hypothetical protein
MERKEREAAQLRQAEEERKRIDALVAHKLAEMGGQRPAKENTGPTGRDKKCYADKAKKRHNGEKISPSEGEKQGAGVAARCGHDNTKNRRGGKRKPVRPTSAEDVERLAAVQASEAHELQQICGEYFDGFTDRPLIAIYRQNGWESIRMRCLA